MNKSRRLYKISIALLTLSLVVIIFDSFKGRGQEKPQNNLEIIMKNEEIEPVTPTPKITWKTYKNQKYNFSVDYPKLLLLQEFEKPKNYIFGVEFAENMYTPNSVNGILITITDRKLEEEKTLIKEKIQSEGGAVLKDEIQFKDLLFPADVMYFEPKEGEKLNPKAVAVIESDEYVFTVSTSPNQIYEVLKSFKYPAENTENKSQSKTIIGCNGGVPCPYGFECKPDPEASGEGESCVKK